MAHIANQNRAYNLKNNTQDRYLITVCRRCHARIHRTRMLLKILPALLIELWREQHPDGVEQLAFDFDRGESPEQLHLV
jgi:hypothetical protein